MTDQKNSSGEPSGVAHKAEKQVREVELIENDHRPAFTGGGAPYDRRGPGEEDERESAAKNVPAINQNQTDDQNKLVDQTEHQNRP